MSVQTFAVNNALSNKLWAKKLNAEALKETYFGRFMGEGSDNMIQVQTDLEKAAGDQVTVGLRMQMVGDGVTEGQTLQGNEESLALFNDKLTINELAHAVRVKNKNSIDAQRVPFNLRNEGKAGLKDWYAGRLDVCMANHLTGNSLVTDMRYSGNNAIVAPTNIFRPNSYTDDASVGGDNTAKMNIQFLDTLLERAETATPLIRPIMVNGEKKYLFFMHNTQVTDMRTSTSTGQWLDIEKAALAGGASSKSPIYTGALGEYNGIILHKWFRLPQGISNAGAYVSNTRRAVFCGAQAGFVGFGKEFSKGSHFKWIEELFDYERELGVSAQTVWGIKKAQFNSADFGTIACTTYAAPH